MSKICFWCYNNVKKGESLCQKCREKYNKNLEDIDKINKEYKEIFGDLDCIGQINLVKNLQNEIKRLKKNYLIGKHNLQNRLIKYPIYLDNCKVSNNKQLFAYINELQLERNYYKNRVKDLEE